MIKYSLIVTWYIVHVYVAAIFFFGFLKILTIQFVKPRIKRSVENGWLYSDMVQPVKKLRKE